MIHQVQNTASIFYDEDTISSIPAITQLLLPPTITKTVDKALASIGETLTYIIVITNIALNPITNLPFTDVIPEGVEYIEDSFTVNTVATTPTITDSTLTYTIANMDALGETTITFQVEVVGGETDD